MPDLVNALLKAGLLQFGSFDGAPFKVNLELLPSYPAILGQIGKLASGHIAQIQPERLVCTSDALPFGIVLSMKCDVPLVYSLGSDAPGVHDLVGAYDVGHPSLLLVNSWQPDIALLQLIDKASHVGLEINAVLALLDYQVDDHPGSRFLDVFALLNLRAVVDGLAESGRLPAGQRDAVIAWLDDDGKNTD